VRKADLSYGKHSGAGNIQKRMERTHSASCIE